MGKIKKHLVVLRRGAYFNYILTCEHVTFIHILKYQLGRFDITICSACVEKSGVRNLKKYNKCFVGSFDDENSLSLVPSLDESRLSSSSRDE